MGYFEDIKDRYTLQIGANKTLVLFFDAMHATNNPQVDIFSADSKGFSSRLVSTAKEFCNRFNAIAVVGVDEITFIVEKPQPILNRYKNTEADILTVLSQEICLYFNGIYKPTKPMYFHGRLFCIRPEFKLGFINYQMRRQHNVLTSQFLKRFRAADMQTNLEDKLKVCNSLDDYRGMHDYFKYGGVIQGNKLYDPREYSNGNLVEYPVVFIKPSDTVNYLNAEGCMAEHKVVPVTIADF